MSNPEMCPHCGTRPAEHTGAHAVATLTREVTKLQELASTRMGSAEQQRIDELSREVQQLRETVARLRGAPSATAGYR